MNSNEIENGITHLYNNDIKLAKIIETAGKLEYKPRKDYYFALLRSIINQQLSNAAAATILKRFVDHFGKLEPERILAAPDHILRGLGTSLPKAKYIKDLSAKVLNKEIDLKKLSRLTDNEIIEELTKIKGIGEWTVHMFLMFTLGRLNVLPVGDQSIKRAVKNIYNLRSIPGESKIRLISKKNNWAPYNSIASWYLWKSLEIDDWRFMIDESFIWIDEL